MLWDSQCDYVLFVPHLFKIGCLFFYCTYSFVWVIIIAPFDLKAKLNVIWNFWNYSLGLHSIYPKGAYIEDVLFISSKDIVGQRSGLMESWGLGPIQIANVWSNKAWRRQGPINSLGHHKISNKCQYESCPIGNFLCAFCVKIHRAAWSSRRNKLLYTCQISNQHVSHIGVEYISSSY